MAKLKFLIRKFWLFLSGISFSFRKVGVFDLFRQMIVELDPSFGFLWIISKLFFNLSDPMATSLKMSLTTVGKSGPPYTRVQSGHDLIRGDLRLGLPCELLIEVKSEVISFSGHFKPWLRWSNSHFPNIRTHGGRNIDMGVKLENSQTGRSPTICYSTVVP